jgi:hypothetical protein
VEDISLTVAVSDGNNQNFTFEISALLTLVLKIFATEPVPSPNEQRDQMALKAMTLALDNMDAVWFCTHSES